jgi:predicted nucleic acid-binding protein
MILIDTSVLIDFFRGKDTPEVNNFEKVIEKGIPFGICNFVFQELLQGAKTEQEFVKLKDYLESIPFYNLEMGRESYKQAAKLHFQCRRVGITIQSSIDFLIAQIAIENKLDLLHADNDFTKIANVIEELRIYT